ncbi:MAG: septum formation inhibitor Maf [Candidatus Fermentithermobacillus carboniphilus]|uniref:dTTP/UTP pyrophosphatase n=1 Tax=Candidatus Fermentithermobacillus carboniphilus TaxID=3085328 RepID=A0AAT9LBI2_9FIRM|nr:MAG: septum formation inhibitor Maf [Candidatus Fermentithermobacillus carboniphilus]
MKLILASESSRRKALLETLGISPLVVPSHVEEKTDMRSKSEDPAEVVTSLARKKVSRVAKSYPEFLVLGADTLVVLDGVMLGKPRDPEDACAMLERLSGRTHLVYTGVALYDPRTREILTDFDCTRVTMKKLAVDEISWYVGTGEPLDKAGSYALQGLGALFVTRIEGDYTSVIGLPLPKTYRLLKRAKVSIEELLKG